MTKTITTIIISICLLIGGAIAEQIFIKNTFDDIKEEIGEVIEKLEDETATVEDTEKVRDSWVEKKKTLHAFISHNDIKEFDLWLSEAVSYCELGKYDEAKEKLDVALNLANEVPKGYMTRFENIF